MEKIRKIQQKLLKISNYSEQFEILKKVEESLPIGSEIKSIKNEKK